MARWSQHRKAMLLCFWLVSPDTVAKLVWRLSPDAVAHSWAPSADSCLATPVQRWCFPGAQCFDEKTSILIQNAQSYRKQIIKLRKWRIWLWRESNIQKGSNVWHHRNSLDSYEEYMTSPLSQYSALAYNDTGNMLNANNILILVMLYIIVHLVSTHPVEELVTLILLI